MTNLGRYALYVTAAALIAGCRGPLGAPSGMPQTIETTTHVGFAETSPQYQVSTPLVYVTSFVDSYVKIFRAKDSDPKSIAKISKGVDDPNGDCLDAQGTLYVVNEQNSVSEYALGKPKLVRTITQGLYDPGFCAIDGGGNLWVTNLGGRHGAFIRKYKPGSTKPDGIIKTGSTHPTGIAIDQSGNIYVADLEPYATSSVQVYPPGGKSPSRTITDGLHWPIGVAVDEKGTLYVTNDGAPCNVEEYRAGENHPYRTITDEINGPTAVAVGKNGWLYVGEPGVDGCSGPSNVVLEFAPGSIKPSKREIKKGLYDVAGVAVYPPLLP